VVRQAPAEEPAATTKPTKGGKGGKGGEVDDETKKALDELQKAQLERSF
jgi:GTPase involved in cell partitioning and DNA repair